MPLWAPLVPQQRELAPLSATLWGDEVHPVLVCGECAGHEEMPFATLSALGTGGRRAGQAVQVPPMSQPCLFPTVRRDPLPAPGVPARCLCQPHQEGQPVLCQVSR